MYRKILSNQIGHGTIDDMRQFPVAECDKKHIHKGCKCMSKTEIVDPTLSQEDEYSLPEALRYEYERTGIDEPTASNKDRNDELRIKLNKIYSGEQLPDSGARRKFGTGSVRDIRTGKGRYDLISPIALASLAKRLEDGMTKYGVRNWEKGQNLMSYLDSCLRHINRFITDAMMDRAPEEDHISAAFWNLHSFIHTQYMIMQGSLPAELDDIPTPRRVRSGDSK